MYPQEENKIIDEALQILRSRLQNNKLELTSSKAVKEYCFFKLAEQEREVFSVLFMNHQNCMIEYQEMFKGTVNNCSIHPREVVKEALALNAVSVIICHNHPSGSTLPSQADKEITQGIIKALQLVQIDLLDHIIVGNSGCLSFNEEGLL